jgi:hypothetical protein
MKILGKKYALKPLAISTLLMVLLLSPLFTAGAETPIGGLEKTAGEAFSNSIPFKSAFASNGLPGIAGTIVGSLLALLGIVFMILIIYGGFRWMFARGNEQDVTKAKDIITQAIVGLIIVFSAYAIAQFVGSILGQ